MPKVQIFYTVVKRTRGVSQKNGNFLFSSTSRYSISALKRGKLKLVASRETLIALYRGACNWPQTCCAASLAPADIRQSLCVVSMFLPFLMIWVSITYVYTDAVESPALQQPANARHRNLQNTSTRARTAAVSTNSPYLCRLAKE